MSVKNVIHEETSQMSDVKKAILLSLIVYLVWMGATYFLEGRINLLRQPTVIGRYVYVLVANVLVGTVGAIWLLGKFLNANFVNLEQLGFRPGQRTFVTAVIGVVVGFGLFLLQGPASLAPIVLLNVFAQVLPVSIAEVVVCWAVVGVSFETLAQSKGKGIGIGVGILAATLLFAVYHFAHSAPFNQLNMVVFLLFPGLLTSLVYFFSREIYTTILFHNFLGMIGVIGSVDLNFLSQPLYPLYGLVLISILVLIAADIYLIRRKWELDRL